MVGSVQKGQRVVVTGRLRIRDWEADEKKGTSVEVDAEAMGHDLSWGSSVFTRSAASALAATEAGQVEAGAGAGDSEAADSDEVGAGGARAADEDDSDTFARPALAEALPF